MLNNHAYPRLLRA